MGLTAQWQCSACKKLTRDARHKGVLGKPVCARCHDIQVSGTLGMMTASGSQSQAQTAITVSGIRRWLRRAKGE